MSDNYVDQLRQIVLGSVESLREISAMTFNEKPSPEKWSKKELLGHLIDSAYNNHQRILRAESQKNLVFIGYDQDEWVKRNNYQQRDRDEVLKLWEGVNYHLGMLISGLNKDLLEEKTSAHNFDEICFNSLESGTLTSLSYLIEDYLNHLEYHLEQLIEDYVRII